MPRTRVVTLSFNSSLVQNKQATLANLARDTQPTILDNLVNFDGVVLQGTVIEQYGVQVTYVTSVTDENRVAEHVCAVFREVAANDRGTYFPYLKQRGGELKVTIDTKEE